MARKSITELGMSIEIRNGLLNHQLRESSSEKTSKKLDVVTAPSPEQSVTTDTANINLSAQGQLFQRIEAKLNSTPEVDMDKVERVRTNLLENGLDLFSADKTTAEQSAARIAERILSFSDKS